MLTPLLKVGDIPQKNVKWLKYWQTFLRSDDLAFVLILTHNSGLSLGFCDRVSGQDAHGSTRPCSNLPEYSSLITSEVEPVGMSRRQSEVGMEWKGNAQELFYFLTGLKILYTCKTNKQINTTISKAGQHHLGLRRD